MSAARPAEARPRAAVVKRIRVALIGNPNVGKSAIFNALTGGRAWVGNWPGVTVEKKVGRVEYDGYELEVVDLPGIYSLTAYSIDEKIARDYIVNEKPDVVVDIVNAASLERNLYLALMLLEMGANLVIALNMIDVAEKQGYRVDAKKLEELLGVPVAPTIAVKGVGIRELLEAIVRAAERPRRGRLVSYGDRVEEAIRRLERIIAEDPELAKRYPARWIAVRLLEGDEDIERLVEKSSVGRTLLETARRLREELERELGDLESYMVTRRYEVAADIARRAVKAVAVPRVTFTDVLDSILAHRVVGIPVALAFLYLVFRFAFDVSAPLSTIIDMLINDYLYSIVAESSLDPVLKSLLADGVIAGVGAVLVFLPVITFFYIGLAFLEDVGYMARIAFIVDKILSRFGVSGKAIIPLIIGFGCNVPAVMATRAIEDENERKTVALIAPLASCSARLPVYLVVGGALFAAYTGLVVMSLYLLGVVVALLIALLFRKTLFRGPSTGFIMELPPYMMPSLRNIALKTWERTKKFLIKAGVVIVAAMMLVWALSVTGPQGWLGPEALEDPALLEKSWVGLLGHALAPLFAPMGWDWRAVAALVFGIIAKENVVGMMAVLYNVAGEEELTGVLSTVFNPVTAYAYMVFVLLYVPCVATLAAIRSELGLRYALFALAYQVALAYTLSLLVVLVGQLL